MSEFDVLRYKSDLRQSWDAASIGWEKWWNLFERAAQPASDRLVALARIRPGDRVLDIATGTGEPAITAARAVGPTGYVLGVDQSAGMLAAARRRASSLGLNNIEYREGDGDSLPVSERNFDAVLCRWGLMFMPDLDCVARGIREVLKPQGWFATAVWSTPDKVPMISLAQSRVREIGGIPEPLPGDLDPLRLADTTILTRVLKAAGFREAKVEPLVLNYEFDSPEAFLQFRSDVSPPFREVLEKRPPEICRQIEEAVLAEARRCVGAEGRVRVPSEALLVAAHI